jgi:putative phosphoribosyl transferase
MLSRKTWPTDTIVAALPRGGVPIAYEISRALRLPMDICTVRKLGTPQQPELAMGAIGTGGAVVLNRHVIRDMGVTTDQLVHEIELERAELDRRETKYRQGEKPLSPAGKTVILVDDGIATGATVEAAIKAMRQRGAKRVVVATGVAARETVSRLVEDADGVYSVLMPDSLHSIGEWYEDFEQVSDAEVCTLLDQAAEILVAT